MGSKWGPWSPSWSRSLTSTTFPLRYQSYILYGDATTTKGGCMTNVRRSILIEEELWREAQKAALRQGLREERSVPVSEWIRTAMRLRLERED